MQKESPNVPQQRSNADIWHEKMVAIHGSEDAVSSFMRTIGAKGGKKPVKKGFGSDKKRASAAGKKSGQVRRIKRAGRGIK